MCSFDTVIHPCPVLGDWVRTDQTCDDCAGEHLCDSRQTCPLGAQFSDVPAPVSAPRQLADLRDWRV